MRVSPKGFPPITPPTPSPARSRGVAIASRGEVNRARLLARRPWQTMARCLNVWPNAISSKNFFTREF